MLMSLFRVSSCFIFMTSLCIMSKNFPVMFKTFCVKLQWFLMFYVLNLMFGCHWYIISMIFILLCPRLIKFYAHSCLGYAKKLYSYIDSMWFVFFFIWQGIPICHSVSNLQVFKICWMTSTWSVLAIWFVYSSQLIGRPPWLNLKAVYAPIPTNYAQIPRF